MERRTFLARLGQTLVAVPVLGIASGCGGDDPTEMTDAGPTEQFTTPNDADATGHTHDVTLLCTSLNGGTLTYSSSFAGNHSHNIRFEFDEVTRLLNGEVIPKTSTSAGGHTHSWTFQRPAGVCT